MKRLLFAVLVVLALAPAAQGTAPATDVRFATFNASLNRPSDGLLTTHLANPASTTSSAGRRRTSPRSSSASVRTSCSSTSSTPATPTCRRPETCSATTSSRSRRTARAPIEYPYAFIAPSNTGVAIGQGPQQQRRVTTPGAGMATTRSASARSPASSGWSCSRSTRSRTDEVRTFQLFRGRTCPAAL